MQKLPGQTESVPVQGTAGLPGREAPHRRSAISPDDTADRSLADAMVAGVGRSRDDRAGREWMTVGTAGVSTEARVQRIEEMVTREVVRFRWSGQESVSVVIRPDPGTEVTVHLRQRDGHLEAMLGMTREEAVRFEGHWKQLHDALAEQNVRLIPTRDGAQLAQAVGAGASTGGNAGSGNGNGNGSGWNPPSGGQNGTGPGWSTDWREGQGSPTRDGHSDRRGGHDRMPGDLEAPRTRTAVASPRPARKRSAAEPEGWEFWA